MGRPDDADVEDMELAKNPLVDAGADVDAEPLAQLRHVQLAICQYTNDHNNT